MQKIHTVTIASTESVPFVTRVMGNKIAKNGVCIPISKGDAIDVAYARFFESRIGISLSELSDGTAMLTRSGEVYIANMSATTLRKLSAAYRQHLIEHAGYKAFVETTTLSGVPAGSVGKKRSTTGKRKQSADKKAKKAARRAARLALPDVTQDVISVSEICTYEIPAA